MWHVGNWKLDDGEDVYLKVIDFPVPEGCPVGGESMWVRKKSGTDEAGTGLVANDPIFCEEVGYGDAVEYAGGSANEKPKYVRRVETNGA